MGQLHLHEPELKSPWKGWATAVEGDGGLMNEPFSSRNVRNR